MTMAATMITEPEPAHVSVMLREVVLALSAGPGLYLDLTAGWGGHSHALLSSNSGSRLIAFDRDPLAVDATRHRLAVFGDRVTVVHGRFSDAEAWLRSHGVEHVDGLLADLGTSSPQLDDPERGMTFRAAGPLDMRMNPLEGETALELIERLSQDELADVIYQFGEERRSRRVARCIKQALERGELESTLDLRRAIVRAVGPQRVGGVDPATRTFQGLRIAVNGELDELTALLDAAERLVRPGGVAAFISFHSLEDRLVKRAFSRNPVWAPLTKKPQTASFAETDANPRSRSAKLRAARRTESDGGDERYPRGDMP